MRRDQAFAPTAWTACRRQSSSEEAVQLDEAEAPVLERVPGYAVVDAHASPQLEVLDRRVLVDQRIALLLVVAHVGVGLEGLDRRLQVVALPRHPVALDQPDPSLQVAARQPAVFDVVDLGEPGDRPGAQAREQGGESPVRGIGVVEARARAETPARTDVLGARRPLLAGVALRAAGRSVRHRELRAPRARFEADLDAVIRRVETDSRHLADEGGVVLQPQAEWQVHLPGLDVVAPRVRSEE